MNKYSCILLLPSETKELIIEADAVSNDSTCATTFTKRVQYRNDFGTVSYKYEIVMQVPTDKLIIESVEYGE